MRGVELVCDNVKVPTSSWCSSILCPPCGEPLCSCIIITNSSLAILLFKRIDQRWKCWRVRSIEEEATSVKHPCHAWSSDAKYIIVGLGCQLLFYNVKNDFRLEFLLPSPTTSEIREINMQLQATDCYFITLAHSDGLHLCSDFRIESSSQQDWSHLLRSYPISCSTLSMQLTFLAIATVDGHVGIWRTRDFGLQIPDAIWSTSIEQARTTSIQFTPCESYACFAAQNGSLFVYKHQIICDGWDVYQPLRSFQLSQPLNAELCFVEWSSCSRFLIATGSSASFLIVIHASTGKICQKYHLKSNFAIGLCNPSKSPEFLCLTSNGQVLAVPWIYTSPISNTEAMYTSSFANVELIRSAGDSVELQLNFHAPDNRCLVFPAPFVDPDGFLPKSSSSVDFYPKEKDPCWRILLTTTAIVIISGPTVYTRSFELKDVWQSMILPFIVIGSCILHDSYVLLVSKTGDAFRLNGMKLELLGSIQADAIQHLSLNADDPTTCKIIYRDDNNCQGLWELRIDHSSSLSRLELISQENSHTFKKAFFRGRLVV